MTAHIAAHSAEQAEPVPAAAEDANQLPPPPPQRFSHTLTAVFQAPGRLSTADEDAAAIPAASSVVKQDGTAPTLTADLRIEHFSSLLVDETVVRGIATTPNTSVTLTLERTPLAPETLAPSGMPTASRCEVGVNIAALLLGDHSASRAWPSAAIAVPEAFRPYLERLEVHLSCWRFAAELTAESIELPRREATTLLPPGLSQRLNPVLITIQQAESLPDLPARRTLLDTRCYSSQIRSGSRVGGSGIGGVQVVDAAAAVAAAVARAVALRSRSGECRYKLPGTEAWRVHAAAFTQWRDPATPQDSLDPTISTRDLHVAQSDVLFAVDLDAEAFLDACRTAAMVLEVHDRDARPEVLPLAMPARDESLESPKPTPPPPRQTTPPKTAVRLVSPDKLHRHLHPGP